MFIRLAVKTVAVFVICWLPISILSIAKSSAINVDADVESTCFTIAFSNSIINPFIYFAHLRKAIGKAFGCIATATATATASQLRDGTVTRKLSSSYHQEEQNNRQYSGKVLRNNSTYNPSPIHTFSPPNTSDTLQPTFTAIPRRSSNVTVGSLPQIYFNEEEHINTTVDENVIVQNNEDGTHLQIPRKRIDSLIV